MLPTALALTTLLSLLSAEPQAGVPNPHDPHHAGRIPVLVMTGDGAHDWQWTSTYLRSFLEASGKFDVSVTTWPESDLSDPLIADRYQVFVMDFNSHGLSDNAEQALRKAVRAGVGVVGFHSSTRFFGGQVDKQGTWSTETRRSEHRELNVKFAEVDHPVTAGLSDFEAHPDELVVELFDTSQADLEVLATAYSDPAHGGTGNDEPVLFAGTYGNGRVVYTTLGNVSYGDERTWASFRDTNFQQLVIHAVEWTGSGQVTPLRIVEPNTLTPADRAAGWELLFNGQDGGDWSPSEPGMPSDKWMVENGCLKVLGTDGPGGMQTVNEYRDFELELEWRTSRKDTVGLYYGASPDGNGFTWQTRKKGERDPFGEVVPGMQRAEGRLLRPAGEFNHVRIVASGNVVEHWLNGVQIASFFMSPLEWAEKVRGRNLATSPEMQKLPIAHLAVESDGYDLWVRNMKIRELYPVYEDPLEEDTGPRPIPLFDGSNLDEWQERWAVGFNEPRRMWEIDGEGNLICRGFAVGYLRTKRAFDDYLLEVDWRYSPQTRQISDSGVIVSMMRDRRAPEYWPKGIEVTILSGETGTLFNHWDVPWTPQRRTSGWRTDRLADGENRIGDWNTYQIRKEGGNLTVTLNGVEVNRISGLPTTEGNIGLMSKRGEIHFRNIRVTPLR